MFKDRKDAGQKLAEALTAYKGEEPLVLAIPRGGVVVGHQVAGHFKSDFSIIVVRKLPFPDNPEAEFGAIAEDGSTYFVERALDILPSDTIEQIIEEQKLEINRRIDVLRKGRPLPAIKNRTVILVDDGIAVGSTMVLSHCEIPCGIYDDRMRLDMMAEHITTIETAMKQIHELSEENNKNHNQLVRWIVNKENHADYLSDIVTQYFMK